MGCYFVYSAKKYVGDENIDPCSNFVTPTLKKNKNWGPGGGKAKIGLATTQAPNLDSFLPGKNIPGTVRVNFFEKKNYFCTKMVKKLEYMMVIIR
jgi:hypothetical protein